MVCPIFIKYRGNYIAIERGKLKMYGVMNAVKNDAIKFTIQF